MFAKPGSRVRVTLASKYSFQLTSHGPYALLFYRAVLRTMSQEPSGTYHGITSPRRTWTAT